MDAEVKKPLYSLDAGLLILRATLGLAMLTHGIPKLLGGVGNIQDTLAEKGIPEFIAYGVHIGETVAPILIIIGLFTRPAAAVFVFNMIFATILVHSGDMFQMGEHGGLVRELNWLYILCGLSVMLMGAGRYSVSKGRGKWD